MRTRAVIAIGFFTVVGLLPFFLLAQSKKIDSGYANVNNTKLYYEIAGKGEPLVSLGSFIAIDFALAYPNKCISLIPIGPRVAGDGTDEYKTPNADSVRVVIAKTTDLVKNKGAKEATDYLWTGNHPMGRCIVTPTTRDAMLKMGYEYSWWRYIYPSKREYIFPMAIKKLNEIKVPTLVVTAEHDLGLCKEVAAILAKGIPNVKLVSIKNAGHIMNMDNPKQFNKAISEFIDKIK